MNEMSLESKQAINRAIQALTVYIHRQKYSQDCFELKIITGTGDAFEVDSVETAERCKQHLQAVLDLEKLYAK